MLLERLKMQFNNSLIEEIFFNQVLPNLKNGSIEIPIYNTNSNGDIFTFNVLVDAYDETSPYYLCIQDKEKLVNLLDEYMQIMLSNDSSINKQNIYDKIKYYLTLVWVNATYEDLRNSVRFIQKYIDFNNNPLFEDEFYPENISDVSVSAILALTVFMDSLNDMNIKNIKVVPFLPIRYKNRKSEYEKKYQLKLKQLKVDEIKELKQNLEEKRLLIQSTLTNKFIRDFMRLKHHFNGIDILSYSMEVDEYLSININNMECHNNKLIENILSNKVQDDYTL